MKRRIALMVVAAFAVGYLVAAAQMSAPDTIMLSNPDAWTAPQRESLEKLISDINRVNRQTYKDMEKKKGE